MRLALLRTSNVFNDTKSRETIPLGKKQTTGNLKACSPFTSQMAALAAAQGTTMTELLDDDIPQ
jgi:hypothetical protein